MSLANTIVVTFMVILTLQSVVEYFFFWDTFEKKFEGKFLG